MCTQGAGLFLCVQLRPQLLTHPLNCMVLMLKPRVGLMVVMSSPLMRLTIVVLPALSRPLFQQAVGGNSTQTKQRSQLHSGRPLLLLLLALTPSADASPSPFA